MLVCSALRTEGKKGHMIIVFPLREKDQRNSKKLHQVRCILGIRKRFFTDRVITHWNSLPREVATAPSLLEFKNCLINTLRHMI